MPGNRNLEELIASMKPTLHDATYVYCCFRDFELPHGLTPLCLFRETEGLTAIVAREDAARAGLPWTFACRMITLAVHSALEAVGFLATIAVRLAQAGIACNVVAAYHHDHLFVPEDRAQEALALLAGLQDTTASAQPRR